MSTEIDRAEQISNLPSQLSCLTAPKIRHITGEDKLRSRIMKTYGIIITERFLLFLSACFIS